MTYYKDASTRASETVTIRLTLDEKRILDHLSHIQNITKTDLIRNLLSDNAKSLGITHIPDPPIKKGRGRPKSKKAEALNIAPTIEIIQNNALTTEAENTSHTTSIETSDDAYTFIDLANDFLDHSKDRGEKVLKEINETVSYLTKPNGYAIFIRPKTSLKEITDHFLLALRDSLKDAPLRFPLKNLYLTYLKMILNFGINKELFENDINPSEILNSFTAKEVADALPRPISPPRQS
ncbi:MAG: hypothetical protein JXR91_12380 [Deltaproteobacteria bacterium]|nr:hypothetical protein [Deltaproteobacteria bacterium]